MRLRVAVIGVRGQVARALQEAHTPNIAITSLGRPTLDLAMPQTVTLALRDVAPDVIINAAAYTAVDKAESEQATAFAINAEGALAVAEAASALNAPLIHLSTDYVFDGRKRAPYAETDVTNPLNAYGLSKLSGERAVAAAHSRHVIVRASWVHAPYGANFVRTMLRLAQAHEEIPVVADQIGRPMAASAIAAALLRVAQNTANDEAPRLLGLFHLGGDGQASWADVAETTFETSARLGGPHARVRRITTAEYPTPATRPLYSVMNDAKLHAAHGVKLPNWRDGVAQSVARALQSSG